jgi:hypothetical protein
MIRNDKFDSKAARPEFLYSESRASNRNWTVKVTVWAGHIRQDANLDRCAGLSVDGTEGYHPGRCGRAGLKQGSPVRIHAFSPDRRFHIAP